MKKVLFVLMISILLVGGCGKKHLLPPGRPKLMISYGRVASDTIVDVLSGDTCWFVSFPGEDFWGSGYYIRFYWGNGDSTVVDEEPDWNSGLDRYVACAKYTWFLAGTTTINFNVTARAYTRDNYRAPSELSKPLIVRVHKDTLKK